MRLGTELATLELTPRLLELAGMLAGDHRHIALRALHRLGVAVPAPTLLALLADAVTDPSDHSDAYDVLQLVTSFDEDIGRVIDRLDGDSRRQLVLWYVYLQPRGGEAVGHALWRRWINEPDEDLAVMAGPAYPGAVCSMARATATQPDGEHVWARLYRFPMLVIERPGAAEALALAPHLLLDRLGAVRLGRIVHTTIATQSLQERCPLFGTRDHRRYRAALNVLRALPETHRVLAGLLRGVELDANTHADLVKIALDVDRAATLRHVARRPRIWRAIARMLARRPQPPDSAFLEAAAGSSDAETAYHAIDALDALDGPVPMAAQARLPTLRAVVARARRGDRTALAALLDATRDADVAIRADAVRWLGRLDHAGAHVAVLERALFDGELVNEPEPWGPQAPVAERAAVALGATTGSRTLLLRRFFTTQSDTCREIIADILCERPSSDSPSWSPFDWISGS